VGGQLHVPAALPSQKSPQYPMDGKLDGPECLEVMKRKIPGLLGIKPWLSITQPTHCIK